MTPPARTGPRWLAGTSDDSPRLAPGALGWRARAMARPSSHGGRRLADWTTFPGINPTGPGAGSARS